MPPLGLAKHRPDEPIKQIDGLVRQAGDQVEGNSDQGGMAALTLVAGDMLRRGTARLADELGKAGLMHAMPAGRIEADRANMVQVARSGQASRRALSLPASGAARRASSGWFPLGAASTHPAAAAARPTTRRSADVRSLAAPGSAARCRGVQGAGVGGRRSGAVGIPP